MATTNSKDDPKAKLSRYQEMRDFSRTADRRGEYGRAAGVPSV
ncbi:hypothetical protein [Caulobacter sp. FWC2]|nr:hypothetical protein [Caulobacter sp. FWC2]